MPPKAPMSAPEKHLLAALQAQPAGEWCWREELGLIQAVYSTGTRGLLKRGLIQVRKTPSQSGKGRPRIEVRLKGAA